MVPFLLRSPVRRAASACAASLGRASAQSAPPARSLALLSRGSAVCAGAYGRSTLLRAPALALRERASAAGAAAAGPAGLALGRRAAHTIQGKGFKTKSSVKKRFKIRGGGVLVRQPSGKRHLNLHKSSARISRLTPMREIRSKGLLRTYQKIFQLSPLRK